MLLVRWSRNLADLERRLVAELNLRLEALPAEKYCHRFQADRGISAEEPCVWDMSSFSSAVPLFSSAHQLGALGRVSFKEITECRKLCRQAETMRACVGAESNATASSCVKQRDVVINLVSLVSA